MGWRELLSAGTGRKDRKHGKDVAPSYHHSSHLSGLTDVADSTPNEPDVERRRTHVLAMLAAHPGARYAMVTDTEARPGVVIVAMGIRGLIVEGEAVTFELLVPKEKYDGFLLLDLVERHGAVRH